MAQPHNALDTRYGHILNKAWPIILANAAVPTLGLIDTAVMGHFGNTTELAALAIASLLFSFIYWSFGFLRMGTTAYVAQADGANDERSLMRVVLQSFVLSLILAVLLLILQGPILTVGLALIVPPEGVGIDAESYFSVRIWGAPATLATYVLGGYFIGRGFSRYILVLQLVLNGVNASLDILFAGVLGWGIVGIAWGTVIAEYMTFALGIGMLLRFHSWGRYIGSLSLADISHKIGAVLNQNGDIFIRTLFLLVSFGFFTHVSSRFGVEVLAANHILLQLISFSAFFMDGFAHVLEAMAGKAMGQRDWRSVKVATLRTSVLAALCAVFLAGSAFIFGGDLIESLTNKEGVIEAALMYLPIAAIYIFLSVAAFQLDGLFIGAAYGSAMRNCSVISSAIFVVLWFGLASSYGNLGLWLSFVCFVVARAVTLAIHLPRLKRRCLA